MTFDVEAAALAIVERAITQQPRSLQKVIGPSELGSPCLHCLSAKIAGWEKRPEAAWIPFVGTSIHAKLEEVFTPEEGWLTETRVSVGRIAGVEVSGTADLFHIPSGTVIDFKSAGANTLRSVKANPKREHKVQASLYCMGYIRAGYDVKSWAIWYVPRNAISLRSGVWQERPFDPAIALDALDRATKIAEELDAFPSTEERDAYISSRPRDKDCYDCARFPDYPGRVPELKTLDALLGIAG